MLKLISFFFLLFLIEQGQAETIVKQKENVQPFQVLSHVDSLSDDGITWQEGIIDPNSRLATRLAWKAFEDDVNQRIKEEMMWIPLKVLSIDGNIVSGLLYNIRILAGSSNCSRYEVNTHLIQDLNCVHFNNGKKAIFRALISEKSTFWKPFIPDSSRVYSTLEKNI